MGTAQGLWRDWSKAQTSQLGGGPRVGTTLHLRGEFGAGEGLAYDARHGPGVRAGSTSP
jgi:hypothetical protein